MKIYAGVPAAARNYVEADRSRADDYYLADGTGIARRYTAAEGRVAEFAPLTGETYETWVAGRDPATGEPRGRLRPDADAVRFVEVVVNGPKSWSLAAALHPDMKVAAAQLGARRRGRRRGWRTSTAGGGTATAPGRAWRSVRPIRLPVPCTWARVPQRGCNRGICWWWTRPGCSTRTLPARC